MAVADTTGITSFSFLACVSAGDAATAATAFFAVLNCIIVGGGGGSVIVSWFDRVDDVDVLVEDGRVAELLIAVVTLGFGVVLLQVHSQGFGKGEGLGAEMFEEKVE